MSDSAVVERSELLDRLAHAEQYVAEALKAVQGAIELLPDDDEEEAAS